MKVLTATFGQFNASLLHKTINFSKKKILLEPKLLNGSATLIEK